MTETERRELKAAVLATVLETIGYKSEDVGTLIREEWEMVARLGDVNAPSERCQELVKTLMKLREEFQAKYAALEVTARNMK